VSEQSAKLRVGLLVDSLTAPAWIHQIVQDIRESTCAEIALVVRNNSVPIQAEGLVSALSQHRHALWALYEHFSGLGSSPYKDPLRPIDLSALLAGCPIMSVESVPAGNEDDFLESDLERIMAYRLDVALLFGCRRPVRQVLGIARYGVWAYRLDDDRVYQGTLPGLWEVMEKNPVTGSALKMMTPDEDGDQVLYRSWAATDLESVKGNQAKYYWKSGQFVVRKLQELHEIGPAALEEQGRASEYSPYSSRYYSVPTNAEMLVFLARVAARKMTRLAWNWWHKEQWFLAYKVGNPHDMPGTLHDLQHLRPGRDRFWADPFPVEAGGRYYLFFEEFLYSNMKAHISVMEMDRAGNAGTPVPVLETEYHLSYPFVFEWDGTYYMIPETKSHRDIQLYRCVDFPYGWELDRVLIQDVSAVDATLYEQDGVWWLFCNIGGIDFSSNEELHLFYADSPLGPWTPHRRNPVKSDVRSSRPAGRLFFRNGSLYRPAQDCSVRMGGALVINKITCLTKDRFQETTVGRIDPGWRKDIYGVHTINRAGCLTVLDCFGYARRFP
jgi:hypothetical protein